jgi:predicted SnoaL-like aldol condensation-catalyzing enzyme
MSGGLGGQGMGGSSAGAQGAIAGALASGGTPSNGGNVAVTGGSSAGGSSSGGAANGGSSTGAGGGSSSGGAANGGSGSGAGGRSSSGGAANGGSSSGAGGSQAGSPGSGGSAPEACAKGVSRANRTLVAQAIDELFVEKDLTAIDRYWSDPYYQHNPIAKSGVATFRSVMSSFVPSASFQYERLLTLADCDLVVVYGRYSQTGLIFDMFRVKGDKIMEHWDSDTNQASEAGSIDALDETAATAEHRALFAQFAATVLVGGDAERAADYLSADFIEHRGTATGPTAFTQYLSRENLSYTKVHHVIADGNFVFALSEGKRGSAGFGFYDLFRFEGGKLVEHWDSRRPIPSSTMSGLGIF